MAITSIRSGRRADPIPPEEEKDPLIRFNSNTSDLKCQILKLSKVHPGCSMKQENKQVGEGIDPFLIYKLFEPSPKEPTLRPYTDEQNFEDYFILGIDYTDTLIQGAKARMKDTYKYTNVIGMTVYNENYGELVESMRGVLLKGNVHNLDLESTLVVIVVDGCDILNKTEIEKIELTNELKGLGLYDREKVMAMRKYWDSNPKQKPTEEVCFVFESDIAMDYSGHENPSCCSKMLWQSYSHNHDSSALVKKDGETQLPEVDGVKPEDIRTGSVRTLFVVKPYNRKKLHSHLWLMYGFCIFLNPDFVFVRRNTAR